MVDDLPAYRSECLRKKMQNQFESQDKYQRTIDFEFKDFCYKGNRNKHNSRNKYEDKKVLRQWNWNYNDKCISGDYKYFVEMVDQHDHWIKVDIVSKNIYEEGQ